MIFKTEKYLLGTPTSKLRTASASTSGNRTFLLWFALSFHKSRQVGSTGIWVNAFTTLDRVFVGSCKQEEEEEGSLVRGAAIHFTQGNSEDKLSPSNTLDSPQDHVSNGRNQILVEIPRKKHAGELEEAPAALLGAKLAC